MPTYRSGTETGAEGADQRRRLAALLADMIPGAVTFRVTLQDPAKVWPQPHAHAFGSAGELIPLNRTQAVTAARWIIRTYPEVSWGDVYDFDLATACLRRTVIVATGRGR
jgi:hypothetical protein